MSPVAAIRFQISVDARLWSSSEVRMNRSKLDPSPLQRLELVGVARRELGRRMPSRCAVCCIFCPCTSVPVRKRTSKPSRRLKRASASAEMYS